MANPRPCIFLVEDDEDLCDVLCELLEADGFDVVAVRDAQVALGWLLSDLEPDVILLDLKLQPFDGYEFWSRLKATGISLTCPVYVFTAVPTIDESRLYGIAGIFRKPFDVDATLAAIRATCDPARRN